MFFHQSGLSELESFPTIISMDGNIGLFTFYRLQDSLTSFPNHAPSPNSIDLAPTVQQSKHFRSYSLCPKTKQHRDQVTTFARQQSQSLYMSPPKITITLPQAHRRNSSFGSSPPPVRRDSLANRILLSDLQQLSASPNLFCQIRRLRKNHPEIPVATQMNLGYRSPYSHSWHRQRLQHQTQLRGKKRSVTESSKPDPKIGDIQSLFQRGQHIQKLAGADWGEKRSILLDKLRAKLAKNNRLPQLLPRRVDPVLIGERAVGVEWESQ